nr:MAG TPA: hypothetical protein [Caudoviricetes sp.]
MKINYIVCDEAKAMAPGIRYLPNTYLLRRFSKKVSPPTLVSVITG